MAESRTITIRVISGEKPVPSPDASPSDTSTTPSPRASESSSKKKKKTGIDAVGTYMAKQVWEEIKSVSKTYTGKYFDATENYQVQALASNAAATIDGVVSLAHSFALGFRMWGFKGAFITTAINAGLKVAGAVGDYASSAQSIIENAYGNYFYGRRAGLVDGGHGTEN